MKSSKDIFRKSIDKASAGVELTPELVSTLSTIKNNMKENEILKGGLADKKNLQDLARKHKIKDVSELEKQLKIGMKVELEHTNDKKKAKEIAMDHIFEDPKYYDKLSKIETKEDKETTSSQNDKDMVEGIIEIVKQVKNLTNRKSIAQNMIKKLQMEKVKFDRDKFMESCGLKKIKKTESKEATGSGSVGAYSAPVFGGNDEFWKRSKSENPKPVENEIEKVEAKEATTSGSVGAYETPAAWAKSTGKKDWRGKSKTQIPGGAFVSVKKKCTKFPYCNKGDINALNIYQNENLNDAILNVSKKLNLSETTIKAILQYEFEKLNKQTK
jgi:hypothetical protein